MPLSRIDIPAGKSPEFKATLLDVLYETLNSTMNVPDGDRFQILTEHSAGELDISPDYLGVERSPDAILIQITLNEGRSVEMKKAFFAALATALEDRLGIRTQDVNVSLVEVAKENWSFGEGVAQYA